MKKRSPIASALGNRQKGGPKQSQALLDARMEAFQALRVIYEIRVAAGDPEGRLTIPELISKIEHLRKTALQYE